MSWKIINSVDELIPSVVILHIKQQVRFIIIECDNLLHTKPCERIHWNDFIPIKRSYNFSLTKEDWKTILSAYLIKVGKKSRLDFE